MLILEVDISCWRGILVILMEEVVDVENIDMVRSCASVVRVVEPGGWLLGGAVGRVPSTSLEPPP
jgi:hypothetical protein